MMKRYIGDSSISFKINCTHVPRCFQYFPLQRISLKSIPPFRSKDRRANWLATRKRLVRRGFPSGNTNCTFTRVNPRPRDEIKKFPDISSGWIYISRSMEILSPPGDEQQRRGAMLVDPSKGREVESSTGDDVFRSLPRGWERRRQNLRFVATLHVQTCHRFTILLDTGVTGNLFARRTFERTLACIDGLIYF